MKELSLLIKRLLIKYCRYPFIASEIFNSELSKINEIFFQARLTSDEEVPKKAQAKDACSEKSGEKVQKNTFEFTEENPFAPKDWSKTLKFNKEGEKQPTHTSKRYEA